MTSNLTSTLNKLNAVPKVKFSNGNEIPIVGLGTYQSKPNEVIQAVKDAIDYGYRHFDCAYLYKNEKEVGEALKSKFDEGTVKREDVFVTSKLWNTFHEPELVEKALRSTLENLNLDYLDLYLIHGPVGFKSGEDLFPIDDKGDLTFSDVDYVDTWKAMENVQKTGLAKSIGVSNFNQSQIQRILNVAIIKPANNQIECHPYLNQQKLIDFCNSKGITVTAYAPLGSPVRPWGKTSDLPVLMNDKKLNDLAEKYNKTIAQILLRYQIQRNVIVIPKSVSKIRIEENFNIFEFELSLDDITFIDSLNLNIRYFSFHQFSGHKYYPFEHEDGQ